MKLDNQTFRRYLPINLFTTLEELAVGLGAVCLLVESFYFFSIPGASTFETSPVDPYPTVVWVAFFGVISVAIFVFLHSDLDSVAWKQAFVLLLCNYGLFFFLPEFRGYEHWGWGNSDSFYHLSYVEEIVALNQLPRVGVPPEIIWYPFEHVLAAELVLLGVPLAVAKYFLSFVFSMLFLTAIAVFVRTLTGRPKTLLYGFAAAVPLIYGGFHTGFLPAILSFMLFPLALFHLERYRRTGSNRTLLFLVLLTISIVYFHPVSLGLLTILFGTTVVFTTAYSSRVVSVPRLRWSIVLVPIVAGYIWYIDFRQTERMILQVIFGILSGYESLATAQTSRAISIPLSDLQIAIRFVQIYGAVFSYFLLAGICILYVLYRMYKSSESIPYDQSYVVYQTGVGFAIAVTFMLIYLIAFNPVRVSRYLILFAIIAIAIGLSVLLRQKPQYNSEIRAVFFVVILLTAGLSGFGIYWGEPNNHLTHSEYEGTEFLLEETSRDVPIHSYRMTEKMQQYVLGFSSPYIRYTRTYQDEHEAERMKSLGYDDRDSAVGTFNRSYVVTKRYDTEYHTADYYFDAQKRELFLYNSTHLERLHDDPTADKPYTNGGYAIWSVSNQTTRETVSNRTDS